MKTIKMWSMFTFKIQEWWGYDIGKIRGYTLFGRMSGKTLYSSGTSKDSRGWNPRFWSKHGSRYREIMGRIMGYLENNHEKILSYLVWGCMVLSSNREFMEHDGTKEKTSHQEVPQCINTAAWGIPARVVSLAQPHRRSWRSMAIIATSHAPEAQWEP